MTQSVSDVISQSLMLEALNISMFDFVLVTFFQSRDIRPGLAGDQREISPMPQRPCCGGLDNVIASKFGCV